MTSLITRGKRNPALTRSFLLSTLASPSFFLSLILFPQWRSREYISDTKIPITTILFPAMTEDVVVYMDCLALAINLNFWLG
jgi:hypothetical protein